MDVFLKTLKSLFLIYFKNKLIIQINLIIEKSYAVCNIITIVTLIYGYYIIIKCILKFYDTIDLDNI